MRSSYGALVSYRAGAVLHQFVRNSGGSRDTNGIDRIFSARSGEMDGSLLSPLR